MPLPRRASAAAGGLLLAVAGLVGCGGGGSGSSSSAPTLTLYNAQHRELVQPILDNFTRETGIQVQVRQGGDTDMANQIAQEGKASPADVFTTENSPAMTLVDSRGGFAKLDQATLDQVPAQYRPDSGTWTGFAARSTVLAYDTTKLKAPDLPASILDLADPKWKGKVGFSPAGADFQAIVGAVVASFGEERASAWLRGLKENGKIYRGNIPVLKAVNSGEITTGIIYHYYFYKDRAESGANSKNVELHHFRPGDAGNFVSVSGVGVLAASSKQPQAQQLVRYLTSAPGQQALSATTALEYSVASNVPANPKLPPLTTLGAPPVRVSDLDGPRVVELMQQAGLL